MSVVHLTEKGYILIPKAIRKRMGVKPGGKVHVAEETGRLIVSAVPEDAIEAATGLLKGNFSLTSDLLKERREERRRERKNRSR